MSDVVELHPKPDASARLWKSELAHVIRIDHISHRQRELKPLEGVARDLHVPALAGSETGPHPAFWINIRARTGDDQAARYAE